MICLLLLNVKFMVFSEADGSVFVFVFFNNVLCLLVLGFGGAKVGLC